MPASTWKTISKLTWIRLEQVFLHNPKLDSEVCKLKPSIKFLPPKDGLDYISLVHLGEAASEDEQGWGKNRTAFLKKGVS